MTRWILILGVGVLTVASALYMASALLFQSFEQEIAVTDKTLDCDRRLDLLNQALSLNPLSPDVRLQLGRTQQRCGRDAIATFRELTEQYPNWGLGWAHLYAVTAETADAKSVFRQAVAKGGYEPEVQLLLLRTSVQAWSELTLELRNDVMELVEMTLNSRAHYLKTERLEVVRDSGLLRLVCLNRTLSACNDL